MPLTTEQSRELVDAIVAAPSLDALEALRRVAMREHGPDVHSTFVELLIDVRREKLARANAGTGPRRIA
jgi:hypothetical protein